MERPRANFFFFFLLVGHNVRPSSSEPKTDLKRHFQVNGQEISLVGPI